MVTSANTAIFSCLWLAFALASCSTDSAKNSARQTPAQTAQVAAQPAPEVAVRNFLTWYQQNQEKLWSSSVVPASVDDDKANVYRVDFDEAKVFLGLLDSSGLVSKAYLANELANMQASDSSLRANPQTDGPPDGFNYDRVVYSQDSESDLKLLARTKPVVTIKANSARVFFPQLPNELREGSELEFLLTKYDKKWLIDEINPVFKD